MPARWVPTVQTPLSFDEAAACLTEALRAVTGKRPTDQVLALALAKTALETGRWQKMYGYCFGNIKARIETYSGLYQTYKCNEVLVRGGRGAVVWFAPEGELTGAKGTVTGQRYEVPPGHPQTRFRAYESAEAGALEYVQFQAQIKRYQAAWQHLLNGQVEPYVRALSAAGYFTAPVETYLKTVKSLHSEFLRRLAADAAEPELVTVPEAGAPESFRPPIVPPSDPMAQAAALQSEPPSDSGPHTGFVDTVDLVAGLIRDGLRGK